MHWTGMPEGQRVGSSSPFYRAGNWSLREEAACSGGPAQRVRNRLPFPTGSPSLGSPRCPRVGRVCRGSPGLGGELILASAPHALGCANGITVRLGRRAPGPLLGRSVSAQHCQGPLGKRGERKGNGARRHSKKSGSEMTSGHRRFQASLSWQELPRPPSLGKPRPRDAGV